MSAYKKRSGLFHRNKSAYTDWKHKLSVASKNRWATYRKSSPAANVISNHQYCEGDKSDENISCQRLDVQVEESQTPLLPKSLIPIDKYRLVIELGHIVEQLKVGCKQCKLQLNICSAKGVQTRGLGGWLYITCDNQACEEVNRISLGKQHRRNTSDQGDTLLPSGNAIFDINTKAASGMLHAGIGERHLNNLFATMNLPQISHTSLKKREDEIGSVLESFTRHSVESALSKEMELSEQNTEESTAGNTGIDISVDTAWQKRGSQRSYSSLSGFTSAIGKKTKKVVHFSSRMKQCRICWKASQENKIPQKHNCRVNWHGSAKAMEPDMFVEMIKDSASQGIKIGKVAGDDDNTGINRIRKEGNVEIVKESDKNSPVRAEVV